MGCQGANNKQANNSVAEFGRISHNSKSTKFHCCFPPMLYSTVFYLCCNTPRGNYFAAFALGGNYFAILAPGGNCLAAFALGGNYFTILAPGGNYFAILAFSNSCT